MKPENPTLQILLVDDEEDQRKTLKAALDKTINILELIDLDLSVITAESSDDVKENYFKRINIQAVLLDWQLKKKENPTPVLLKWMKYNRPWIPVYILTSTNDGFSIIKQTNAGFDDFFSKNTLIRNPKDILDRIIADFKERMKAPFWNAFKDYVNKFSDSWHTPGHSRGASFKNSPYINDFYHHFGSTTFASDLSVSVEKLGSLLDSTNFVKLAQDKAAKTFGVKRTFFSTNGSSTSNKIMLQSIMKPGDKVIIDSNCHKSVHYACIQSCADVCYLKSKYNRVLGIFAPPSLHEIEEKIKTNTDAKVVVITGCTYDGLLIDVKKVIELAKKYSTESNRIKVFIDEAWFAYSGFHPAYYDHSAAKAEADYITHSTHKVLSAFSQASYLHINDPDFDEDFFREIFYIYTSTSPQYQIIASLDIASVQMNLEGTALVEQARNNAVWFIEEVKKLNKIKVLSKADYFRRFHFLKKDNVDFDILKVTLDFSKLNMQIADIIEYLRTYGKLEIEKSTDSTIMLLFTIGLEKDKIIRLYKALYELDNKKLPKEIIVRENFKGKIPEIDLRMIPYTAFYSKGFKKIHINDLQIKLNKKELFLSTRLVTPYPPGIPVLIPGQLIKKDHLNLLNDLTKKKKEIHGCHNGFLYVLPYYLKKDEK